MKRRARQSKKGGAERAARPRNGEGREPPPPREGAGEKEDDPKQRALLSLGIDLGGSLTKVCFFEPEELPDTGRALATFISESTTYGHTGVRDEKLSFFSARLNGRFHFIYFESSHTQGAIDMIKSLLRGRNSRGHIVHATGGGAVKFAKLVEQELGIRLLPEDELETVVRGIVFTLLERPSTCYTVQPVDLESTEGVPQTKQSRVPRPIQLKELFPLLVVNIGSGVSIIKVDSPSSMRRVSGTAVGGGTFFGLCKLLTRCETFEEALDAADRGDSRRVNLLVSDIYGGGYDKVGLPASLTASFFGKVAASAGVTRPASSGSHEDVLLARRELMDPWWIRLLRQTAPLHAPLSACCGVAICHARGLHGGAVYVALMIFCTCVVLYALHVRRQRRRSAANAKEAVAANREIVFRDEDIAKALVTMVAQNITQLGYLNCKVHGTTRIVFTGNFLRHNSIALRTLNENLRAWSGGGVEAIFLEHEGFFGAIGAFLASNPPEVENHREAANRVLHRPSSFHAPEEGDDGFYLNSPKISAKEPTALAVPTLRLT